MIKLFLYLLLLGEAFQICAAEYSEHSAERGFVTYLQNHFNTNVLEYEVVFSIVQHRNPALDKWLSQMNKNGTSVSIDFEKESFTRIRRSKEGFFVLRSDDLTSALAGCVTFHDATGFGVFSNSYWVVGNSNLIIDDNKLKNLKATDLGWAEMANQAENTFFTFGLSLKRGSLVWDQNRFTAELPSVLPVPKDQWGKRLISGYVIVSNGVPYSMVNQTPQIKQTLTFNYSESAGKEMPFPNSVDILEESSSNIINSCKLNIISFVITNFPPNSIGLEPIIHASPGLTIIHQNSKSAQLVQYAGKPIKTPVEVIMNSNSTSVESSGFRRACIVLALFLSSLVGLFIIFRWSKKRN